MLVERGRRNFGPVQHAMNLAVMVGLAIKNRAIGASIDAS